MKIKITRLYLLQLPQSHTAWLLQHRLLADKICIHVFMKDM